MRRSALPVSFRIVLRLLDPDSGHGDRDANLRKETLAMTDQRHGLRRLVLLLTAVLLLSSGVSGPPANAIPADLPVFGPPLGPVLIDTHNGGGTALMSGAIDAITAGNIQYAATGQPCAYRERTLVGSAFSCGFFNEPDVHFVRYQQQIFNPNPFIVSIPVGFWFPGGGSPILGTVVLGVGSSFVIGINVNDNFADSGTQFLWNVNASAFNLRVSAALIEDSDFNNVPGSFDYIFFSDPLNDSFTLDGSVDPLFRISDPNDSAFAVPEHAGLLLLGVGLAAIGTLSRRRASGQRSRNAG